eukprot:2397269-Amphidinium_carterae.1
MAPRPHTCSLLEPQGKIPFMKTPMRHDTSKCLLHVSRFMFREVHFGVPPRSNGSVEDKAHRDSQANL